MEEGHGRSGGGYHGGPGYRAQHRLAALKREAGILLLGGRRARMAAPAMRLPGAVSLMAVCGLQHKHLPGVSCRLPATCMRATCAQISSAAPAPSLCGSRPCCTCLCMRLPGRLISLLLQPPLLHLVVTLLHPAAAPGCHMAVTWLLHLAVTWLSHGCFPHRACSPCFAWSG